MQALFSPSTALMNRLRYPMKFSSMGILLILVIAGLLSGLYGQFAETITATRQEMEGVRLIKPMTLLAQAMQQHRGLSSGVLNGNQGLAERRSAKERDVSAAFSVTEAVLSAKLKENAEWKAVVGEWEKIRSEGLRWTAAESFKRHTEMIERLLALRVDVADDQALTLDPAMDSYYLMDTFVVKLPSLLEHLGQARALGTGLLAKKQISEVQKLELGGLLGEIEVTLRQQNANIAKVSTYTPSLAKKLEVVSKELSADVENLTRLLRQDVLGEKFATPSQDYFNQATTVIDKGYKLDAEVLVPQFETLLAERVAGAQRSMLIYFALAILVVLLLLYLMAGVYYSVMGSVKAYVAGAKRLSEGDLTARFTVDGRDELHDAAQHFDGVALAFQKLVRELQNNIRQLNDAATALATASGQIAKSVETQSASASSMAASVEEMTVGVDHIAQNAHEAQEISRKSDAAAGEGGAKVRKLVDDIQTIADTVTQAASTVESLGRRSDQISTIVGTIKEIADQTNLLALNAAIEAARAGEAGRGFAVVADEVRKLAERTTRSTQEVAETIAAIQAGTQDAVTSIKHGVERVESGVAQAREAGLTIEQVQSQSRQVVGVVEDITLSLREQATASTEIAKNVEAIAQMAEENNAAAAKNRSTAGDLQQLASALASSVARFKV
ncbi:MAG: Histidine kinase, region:Bacterial chemotaxis sensory transducer [Proteobacteria bacterium]|nr:Histidine kinase, region:Bacterial chemotaxis sensory transducer [Pseudomonadota bacterium]